MTVTYMPYTTALIRAIESPIAIWPVVLCGNDPLCSSLLPDRSTDEMSTMPTSDARTPSSFRNVNDSTLKTAQKMSVHMLDVDVRMVTLATLVYSRHAEAK